MQKYFEEIQPGEIIDLGSYEVTREEIKRFAAAYDPQPFHLHEDHDAPFEGIIASGWHTAAMTMRMIVDGYLGTAQTVGAIGLDGLQWKQPVAPGDTLSATATIGEKQEWDEWRGLVTHEVETSNQDGDTVLEMTPQVLYRRK